MSVRFKERLQFGAVTGSQAPELAPQVGIGNLPGIVLLPVQGDPVVYNGMPPRPAVECAMIMP